MKNVEVVVDYAKFEKVLTCDGEPGDTPTLSNNFVDIFEAQQVK